jgi:hypothetical protein
MKTTIIKDDDGNIIFIEDEEGKHWYNKFGYHREDGPAFERYSGSKSWYFNGKLHRVNGPAIEWLSWSMLHLREWYYHGKHIKCSSQEEFERLIKLRAFW